MDENIALGKNIWFKLLKVQIIGQIFNVQSPDCLGKTDFVRINRMFELLGIFIIGIQLMKFSFFSSFRNDHQNL